MVSSIEKEAAAKRLRALVAARRIKDREAGKFDPQWKRWILIILALEVVYILLEFGFNAALLNVASGLFTDPDALDTIEGIGRTLSGVGLGFLIYGLYAMKFRTKDFDKVHEIGALCCIMPMAIAAMFIIQEIIIEGVVHNTTSEERLSATYLSMVSPAIRNGTLVLHQSPISRDTVDRPENKAFLAISGLLMASNDEMTTRITKDTVNNVSTFVYREALDSKGELYDAYVTVDQKITELYSQYQSGQAKIPQKIDEAMSELTRSGFYQELNSNVSGAYQQYQEAAQSIFDKMGRASWETIYFVHKSCNYQTVNASGMSQCKKYSERFGKKYFKGTGSKLNIDKFCSRSTPWMKCKWDYVQIGRLVYDDMTQEKRDTAPISVTVKGMPLDLGKREFYQGSGFAQMFGRQQYNGMTLTARDLVVDNQGQPNLYETIRRKTIKNVYQSFTDAINQPITTGKDDIQAGMTREQFNRTSTVQTAYQAIFGEENKGIFMEPGLSTSEFLEKVVFPHSWYVARDRIADIPKKARDLERDEGMDERGMDAVRAMVVPPIALVLSLFFSLFTLSKVFHHFAALQYFRKQKKFPLKKVKMGITIGFLVVVASFPYFVSENPIIKSGMMNAATGEAESTQSVSKLLLVAMDWMIRAEPIIYPFGNGLIGLPLMPMGQFHDPDAQEEGTGKVKEIESLRLVSVLSVFDAQKELNARGYNLGKPDGLMNRSTMKAIETFQRKSGLTVTGLLDARTSWALNGLTLK